MTGLERRVAGLGGWRGMALAALCGAVMALAQPPLSLPLALFLALPPLVWLLDGAGGWRGGFGLGWAAGVGFFAAGLFWIVEPFLVDPVRHGWMAPFALVGMAGGLALFWGAAFALARLLWLRGAARVLSLAAIWTLAELARSHALTGFPWALAAYAWIETPIMQASALIGPHGLSFATLVAAALPAIALPRFGRPGALALAAALVGLGWGWGALRLAAPEPAPAWPLTVRLVQPNAAQALKWRPDMQAEFYRRHLEMTRAPADPPPDVTIWSESAVPFVLGYAGDLLEEVAAAAPEGVVILGIQRLEVRPDGDAWFNSLAVLRRDGSPSAVYDKHHLVPFGEYIPHNGLIARLGVERLTTLTARGFTPGPGPRLIAVPDLPPFLPLICYEAIFPDRMQPPDGRPEWIVQVTNDAWFGRIAGPYQHFAQARARAIEQGLPLARAANTGISAMIDAKGRVRAALPLGVAGYVDAALPAALPPPLYSRTGDLPLLIAVLGVFLLTASNFRHSLSSSTRE